MVTDDAKTLGAFFDAFRQHATDSGAELARFFGLFENDYRQARTERAATTPHFDLLRIFGLEFAELRHSDALAWFLDPQAEHEQGSLFANALLELIGAAPTSSESYTVKRERHERTDVAFYAARQFAVFVENKVRHTEREEQVSDMVESLTKLADSLSIPRERRFAIFLTDRGDKPVTGPTVDLPGFLVANLSSRTRIDVFECFRRALEARPIQSPLLLNFIDSYLHGIRRVRSLLS